MKISLISILTGIIAVSFPCTLSFAKEINVYSARKEALIKPALDQFSAKTGIKVNLLTGKADALISRLKSEGEHSPADILLTTDVGRLVRAKSEDLTQAIVSAEIEKRVPSHLRDKDMNWAALTLRARPIMYDKDKVDPADLSTLENLAEPKWKGKICIRSSSNIYNQSLVASMIEQLGEEKTQSWLNDFVKNFARPPKGGDRDQVKAVAAGQCVIAVANTYYLAGMLTSADQEEKSAAKKVEVFWPNQNDRGAHINISGAALTKHAPNKEAALQLIDFMVEPSIQAWYSRVNHEYPVVQGVAKSAVLLGMGAFKAEEIQLDRVGELNATAVKLMDKAGWK